MRVDEARAPDASEEPPLNENQPNQRRPAPMAAMGRLCGVRAAVSPAANSARGPSIRAVTMEAAPALVWITMPPAKSSTPY